MDAKEQHALVAECRASGMTAKAWCQQKGIKYRQYLSWATKINRKEQKAIEPGKQQWAAVKLTEEEHATGQIRLNCGKWTIQLDSVSSLALLKEIIKAVDSLC